MEKIMVNDLIDTLAFFDPIDRLEGLVCTFYFANWKRARGPVGILCELLSAIVGYCAPTIEFERGSWSGLEIEKLLARHGVRIWDRGMKSRTVLYFCVKRRQIGWAEYLLARAGVPILTSHSPKSIAAGERARAKGMKEPPARKQSRFFWLRELINTLVIGGGAMIILFLILLFLLR